MRKRTRPRAERSEVRPGDVASKSQKCWNAISGTEACGRAIARALTQAEGCLHVSGQRRAGCLSDEGFV